MFLIRKGKKLFTESFLKLTEYTHSYPMRSFLHQEYTVIGTLEMKCMKLKWSGTTSHHRISICFHIFLAPAFNPWLWKPRGPKSLSHFCTSLWIEDLQLPICLAYSVWSLKSSAKSPAICGFWWKLSLFLVLIMWLWIWIWRLFKALLLNNRAPLPSWDEAVAGTPTVWFSPDCDFIWGVFWQKVLKPLVCGIQEDKSCYANQSVGCERVQKSKLMSWIIIYSENNHPQHPTKYSHMNSI